MAARRKKKKYPYKGTGKPNGRPPHVPTDKSRKEVVNMLVTGLTLRQIGFILGLDRATIAKHYRFEIDTAAPRANSTVESNLFNLTKTQVRAAEFWLVNRSPDRWKHKQTLEHLTTPKERLDMSELEAEEIAVLRQAAQIVIRARQRAAAVPVLEHDPQASDAESEAEEDAHNSGIYAEDAA